MSKPDLELPSAADGPLAFLAGGGEMGARLRAFPWEQHPLGPPQRWPQSLRTVVRIMLTAQQPIWVGWGRELFYLYNDAYKSIIGKKHPHMLGQPTATVWSEVWDEIVPLLDRAMCGDEGTYVEGRLLIMERSGYREETHYTFSYTPIPADGGVGGIVCFNTDSTQRVIGERQLTSLRDLGTAVAELRSARDVWSRASDVLAGNPRDVPFALFYEFDADERGATLVATTGIEAGGAAAPVTIDLHSTAPAWPLARVRDARKPVLVERAALPAADLPKGAWAEPPHAALVMPVATESERCEGAIVFGLNPFRLLDDDYRGYLGLVAAQVGASLGRALAYEHERRRADELAALDRAKTAFFSNVSHELRTPLTLMLGPLDEVLAGADDLPPRTVAELAMARRNAHRLLRLVNTLLDFSRLEAGRMRAAFVPTDLAQLTADLASCFRTTIERAGLTFEVDCPAPSRPVHVDRDMWEKIVFNLLSNAFKHTFTGSVRIALRERADSADGRAHVELVVADTGTGIPAAAIPRLFERFYRVEGAQGRNHEGTGIGLALVADLVKLHGGSVRAASEPGRGSTFTVTLPIGAAHLPPEHVHDVPAQATSGRGVRVGSWIEELDSWTRGEVAVDAYSDSHAGGDVVPPRTDTAGAFVLVADDNADLRAYLVRTLTDAGYRVEAVGDGEAALAVIAERVPDLLVTDVMMPRVDGLALLRTLRARANTASLPVVMLSARAGEEALLSGLEVGVDDYVFKPFSARELIARVESQIRLARTRRAAELASRHGEERLRAVFESIQDVFLAIDRDFRIVYANNVALQWSKTPVDAVRGRTVWEVWPYLAGTELEQMCRRGLAGERVRGELRGPASGRWFDVVVEPSPEGITVSARDVTDLHEARERQSALLESERQARIAAETATRLKEEFLATLSHELRTPLNAILGWTRVLRDDLGDPAKALRALEVIERNGRVQAQLVADMLDMSRILAGRMRIDVTDVDLVGVVHAALDTARPAANAKGVALRFEPRCQPTIRGDGERLQQVVWNLLSNAVKFTPRGGKVEVMLDCPDHAARIRVVDDGEGISPEFLPRLFGRFNQADGSTSRKFGGLGIGLAIVKELVELHGGTVHARSDGIGRGAAFTVELPAAGTAPSAPEPIVNRSIDGATPPPVEVAVDLAALRVLLVEDDEDALALVSRTLRARGVVVTAVRSAVAALDELANAAFDLLISDIGMSPMDGYVFLGEVRRRGITTPALALTAFARPVDRTRALLSGYATHLAKPVCPAEILAATAMLTGRSGSVRRVP